MVRAPLAALLACLGSALAGCASRPVVFSPTSPDVGAPPTSTAPPHPCAVRFEAASPAMARFLGRPAAIAAELVLPCGMKAEEEVPVCYLVPDLREDPRELRDRLLGSGQASLPRLVIAVIDARGAFGHHLCSDSVNEGPRGEALVADLIPALETSLFARGAAVQRFVAGVGLGGWSAMHLQVAYPHAFDGAWAIEPDALDFRSFYGVDLRASRNLYRHADGSAVVAGNRQVSDLVADALAGRVESFEAALGPRGDDGRPLALFARASGEIQPVAAEAIARHDLAQVLRERGVELQPKLVDRLHVLIGERDRFGRDVPAAGFARLTQAAQLSAVVRREQRLDRDSELARAFIEMASTVPGPPPAASP